MSVSAHATDAVFVRRYTEAGNRLPINIYIKLLCALKYHLIYLNIQSRSIKIKLGSGRYYQGSWDCFKFVYLIKIKQPATGTGARPFFVNNGDASEDIKTCAPIE